MESPALKIFETIFSPGNFIFLGILIVASIATWFLSILLNIVDRYLETRWSPSKRVLDVITQPVLMLVFVTGYALAHPFITLPGLWSEAFGKAAQLLTLITLSWFLVNLITNIVARLNVALARFLRYLLTIILLSLSALLFIYHVPAIIVGGFFALIFYLLIQQISSLPPPGFARLDTEKKIYPRIIQSHLFLGTKTTGEKIEQALNLIKEAIGEVDGTGQDKSALFSGFAPSGLDILIKYYIIDYQRIDQIKNDVNLKIIKKLNEAGIELGTMN